MKFFTRELLSKINDPDANIRKQAEIEWSHNSKCYAAHFQKVQQYLPRTFIKEYMNSNGLHDYRVDSIYCTMSKTNHYSCCFELSCQDSSFAFEVRKISDFHSNIQFSEIPFVCPLFINYCEFDYLSDAKIYMGVLCNCGEMEFQFKTVHLLKRARNK